MSNKTYGKQMGSCVLRETQTPAGGVRLETFVPWTLVKRGPKARVVTPLDAPRYFVEEARRGQHARDSERDTALLRALGLAFHWQRLLDEQRVSSVTEIAATEGINVTQVRRLLRLTLLAPVVVERLVDSSETALEQLMRRRWPTPWIDQVRVLLPTAITSRQIPPLI